METTNPQAFYRDGRQKTVFERNKFYATTTLAGFGFIQRSNSRTEVIIWYLIMVIFTIITVRNVTALTSQYLGQSTVTQVSIGRLNDTYFMGVFKLRVQIGLPELYEEYGVPVPGVSKRNLSTDVHLALAKLNTTEKVYTSTWDYVLLPLLSKYCHMMAACEYFNEYCQPMNHMGREFKAMTQPNFTHLRNLVNLALDHFHSLGLSDYDIVQQVGMQFLNLVEFAKSPDIFEPWQGRFLGVLPSYEGKRVHDNVVILYLLKPTRAIGVGVGFPRGLCLRLSTTKILQQVMDSGILGPEPTWKEALEWYQAYLPALTLQYGLDNRRALKAELGELHYWSVEITSSFNSISNCWSNNSKHQCVHDCTARTIERHCHCFPVLVDSHKPAGRVKWCKYQNYNNCLSSAPLNIFGTCTSQCPSDCDIDFMDMQSAATQLRNDQNIELCMNVLQTEIPTFREHYSQSWQNFLAELGGAVDFWLGASVLALLHGFVYILKQLLYACRGSTKTGKNVRKLVQRGRLLESMLIALNPTDPSCIVAVPNAAAIKPNEPRAILPDTSSNDHQTEFNRKVLEALAEIRDEIKGVKSDVRLIQEKMCIEDTPNGIAEHIVML